MRVLTILFLSITTAASAQLAENEVGDRFVRPFPDLLEIFFFQGRQRRSIHHEHVAIANHHSRCGRDDVVVSLARRSRLMAGYLPMFIARNARWPETAAMTSDELRRFSGAQLEFDERFRP